MIWDSTCRSKAHACHCHHCSTSDLVESEELSKTKLNCQQIAVANETRRVRSLHTRINSDHIEGFIRHETSFAHVRDIAALATITHLEVTMSFRSAAKHVGLGVRSALGGVSAPASSFRVRLAKYAGTVAVVGTSLWILNDQTNGRFN